MKFDIESLQDLASMYAQGITCFPRRSGNTVFRVHSLVQNLILDDGENNAVFICRDMGDARRISILTKDVLEHYDVKYETRLRNEIWTEFGTIKFKSMNENIDGLKSDTIIEEDYDMPKRSTSVKRMFLDDLED